MKKIYAFSLAGILLVGILVLGVFLFNLYHRPLGQQLTLIPQPSPTGSVSQERIAPTTNPTATVMMGADNPSGGIVCGQSGAFTILIIGSDAKDLRGRPGSDLTRLARVNFSGKKVGTFALPRDLWVDVRDQDLQNPLITETALGEVYYEAHKRSIKADEPAKMTDGTQASAQMILDDFGVTSDHYMVINLNQLPALIDALGGLPIDIPERTTDPWIGTVIEAGQQTLTGEQLKSYARAIPDSDFARIQRNNLILYALRQKLLDPSVWEKLPALYNQFKNMIVTDLSPQQILSFFCLIREVAREQIDMEQVKPEWTSPGPSNSLLWDKDKVTVALKQLDLLP